MNRGQLKSDRVSSLNSNIGADSQISGFGFFLYLCFLGDFFMHLSARLPGLAVLRPTMLLVALITLVLLSQQSKLKRRPANPIFGAIISLIIYIVVSLPLVEYPGSVLNGNYVDFIKAVVFLFFTAHIVDDEKRLRITIIFFVGCQVFRVLEPLYLHITEGYWGGWTWVGSGEFAGRLGGAPTDVINPNELGFVIVTTVPFLHYILFPSGFRNAVIYLALMPLLMYALILTMSRGAVVALGVVALMVFTESKNKFVLVIVGLISLVLAWSVMSPLQKDRYLSLVSSDSNASATVDGRLDGMVNEFKLGFERPVVGHGLGTTREAKFHSFGKSKASHNFYAELVIEIGLLGMFFFLRYMGKLYQRFKENKNSLDILKFESDNYYVRLNKALTAVFWMYAVYSMNYWGLSQYYWYFFGGIVIAFGRELDREKSTFQSGRM